MRAQGCPWDKNECARAAKDAMERKPHKDDPSGNANGARYAMLQWIHSQESDSDSWSDSDDRSNSIDWNKGWSTWTGGYYSGGWSDSDEWSHSCD